MMTLVFNEFWEELTTDILDVHQYTEHAHLHPIKMVSLLSMTSLLSRADEL